MIGETISHCRVQKKLGGAACVVYRAALRIARWNFGSDAILMFEFSADGKTLGVSRQHIESGRCPAP